MEYKEACYWNLNSYGKAIIIKNPIPKRHRWKAVIGCLLTAGTNWLIPFILKDKIVVRYG